MLSGPSKSDLIVQNLAMSNPALYRQAFGDGGSLGQFLSNPTSILNNPAYGGMGIEKSLQIAFSPQAQALTNMGLSMSPQAQQLNALSQQGFLQQQMMMMGGFAGMGGLGGGLGFGFGQPTSLGGLGGGFGTGFGQPTGLGGGFGTGFGQPTTGLGTLGGGFGTGFGQPTGLGGGFGAGLGQQPGLGGVPQAGGQHPQSQIMGIMMQMLTMLTQLISNMAGGNGNKPTP